ncbi:MAG: hypothetical protein IKF14_09490 [Atopobiaceae bacterium]|nr:hypothetical protein [Atopobiaceae bacterium]
MLPDTIFGMPLAIGEDYDFMGLPLLYRGAYEGRLSKIGETPCVVITPKGQLKPLQVEKLCHAIYEKEALPCLVHAEGATAYQRNAMTERNIAWLSAEHTFSIPFIAASCDARELHRRAARALTPNAQRVAVGAIEGSLMGMTTTAVAHALGVSLSSAGNYFSECEAACPGLVGSRGRARFLQMPDGMNKRTLYSVLRPYFSSPVEARVFLKLSDSDFKVLGTLPLSGMSALSQRTDIADDPWRTYALCESKVSDVFPNSLVVGEHDQPDVLVELWSYRSGRGKGAVDGISLLIDLEELGDGGDERLAEAINTLRKEVLA